MSKKKTEVIFKLVHQLNLSNYIPFLMNEHHEDYDKVEQFSETTFSFYPFFRKDISTWIKETKHSLTQEKMGGQNKIVFLEKSGAVEFKIRFI